MEWKNIFVSIAAFLVPQEASVVMPVDLLLNGSEWAYREFWHFFTWQSMELNCLTNFWISCDKVDSAQHAAHKTCKQP